MENNCKVATLTEDPDLHQIKKCEKELLEPHAKPLSELEQVTIGKIHEVDNTMSLTKCKRSPWNTTKE